MTVRYAPSPTGVLHVGNFRTALIAKSWARHLGTELVFRFEDNDRDRSRPEFLAAQKKDFEFLQLLPAITQLQSDFAERHFSMFLRALANRAVYPCFSSRKEVGEGLASIASAPHGTLPIYDGAWRDRRDYPAAAPHATLSWRFRNEPADGSQDFIVARTCYDASLLGPGARVKTAAEYKFMPAYNWACALDDYDLQPTLLVRAWDLQSVLGQQRALQSFFNRLEGGQFVNPAVFHCSLVTDSAGHRLEKRTGGVTLADLAVRNLSAPQVAQALEASFDVAQLRDFEAGEVFGEHDRSISIAALAL